MSLKKITCKIKGQPVEFVYDVSTLTQAKKAAAQKYGVKESQVSGIRLANP